MSYGIPMHRDAYYFALILPGKYFLASRNDNRATH
jgi:hypothetical protein